MDSQSFVFLGCSCEISKMGYEIRYIIDINI